mmetsp:Transcript_14819/g.27137  ORF Transcript_14819/g.27137 Transcript_14819/m.27137 type:complete len:97 (+) Transcript_14819:36-326(+)
MAVGSQPGSADLCPHSSMLILLLAACPPHHELILRDLSAMWRFWPIKDSACRWQNLPSTEKLTRIQIGYTEPAATCGGHIMRAEVCKIIPMQGNAA